MDVVYGLLEMIPLVVTAISFLALLFVMLISVVYIMGYVCDSIFGNSLIKLGHFISRKYPKIKSVPIVLKMWRKIQPKELYLRYETPLVAYCFSYSAISLVASVLPGKYNMGIIIASALYLGLYFVGMARKCGDNKQYYEKILDNNIQFLKLSFLPLGFIITVVGFCFTITGMKLQEIPFNFATIENAYMNWMNYNDETNTLILIPKMLLSSGLVLISFYIISLPVQVVSYFVISIINYFRKYKVGYIGLFKKFSNIVMWLSNAK